MHHPRLGAVLKRSQGRRSSMSEDAAQDQLHLLMDLGGDLYSVDKEGHNALHTAVLRMVRCRPVPVLLASHAFRAPHHSPCMSPHLPSCPRTSVRPPPTG
jgi:hypothetical protein